MTHVTLTMNSIGNIVVTNHGCELEAWYCKKEDLTSSTRVATVGEFNIKANANVNLGVLHE